MYQELLRSAKIFDSALLPADVHESPKKNQGVTDLKRYSRCVPTYYSTQKKSCFDPAPSLADQATQTPIGTSDLQFHEQNEKSHESQLVPEFLTNEAKSPMETSSQFESSAVEDQYVKDNDTSTSRLEFNGTQLSVLHSSEVPYIMNVKVEEDM